MTEKLRQGDTVRIRKGIAPRAFVGLMARVEAVTEYGYLLRLEDGGTEGGGTGMYRALECEVVAVGIAGAREQGYTGDACPACGGFKMVRNGSCLLCTDCGTTTGCS